jgi:RNA-directed DNA polymerase
MRMKVKLNQIAKKAMQDKRFKFTSLIHHVNVDNLALCYQELKRNKACGIDNVTVEEYGKDLRRNLTALVERLKAKKYRPKPVRRVYIPKAGKSEKRGLGIPSVEDKIVQIMLKKILESIYEADFLDCSYGFRPKRSCHTAINVLDKSVMTKPVNFIVEVDIKRFFDNVSHYWLHKCLEERISDPNLLWLVRRFLKSGIIEEGQYQASNQGTPQGGNLSPLLSNIYLHYVLDLWFEKKFKAKSKGYVELIRYCDDFVVCCESKQDAEDFLNLLKQRFAKFSLELSEDKTQMIRFGRNAWKLSKRNNAKASTFNFLGFTHYCATSRRGKFIMGHKTSKENLRSKLVGINAWLKKIRSMLLLKDWWPILKAKLTGHYNYFGISGNYRSIKKFYEHVKSIIFKWINRRSQKKSMSFDVYLNYLQFNPLPEPKICYSLYAY